MRMYFSPSRMKLFAPNPLPCLSTNSRCTRNHGNTRATKHFAVYADQRQSRSHCADASTDRGLVPLIADNLQSPSASQAVRPYVDRLSATRPRLPPRRTEKPIPREANVCRLPNHLIAQRRPTTAKSTQPAPSSNRHQRDASIVSPNDSQIGFPNLMTIVASVMRRANQEPNHDHRTD
jgi:hypothetical protein